MNWKRFTIVAVAALGLLVPVIAIAAIKSTGGASPDRPPFAQGEEGEEGQKGEGDYLSRREQYIANLRGIGAHTNPLWRGRAVARRAQQHLAQRDLRRSLRSGYVQQQQSVPQPTQYELALASTAPCTHIGPT